MLMSDSLLYEKYLYDYFKYILEQYTTKIDGNILPFLNNPNISLLYINNMVKKYFNYDYVIENYITRYIDHKDIQKYPSLSLCQWNYWTDYVPKVSDDIIKENIKELLYTNSPLINMDIANNYLDILPIDFIEPCISFNPNITITDILNNPKIPWNFNSVYWSKTIDIESHIKLHQKYSKDSLWIIASENPGINLEDIEKHIDCPWDYQLLSRNINISLYFVIKYIDKNWNWRSLTVNPSISIKEIFEHQELPWIYNMVVFRIDFNFSYVNIYNMLSLSNTNDIFMDLSENTGITMSFVLNNRNAPFDWQKLSKNYALDVETDILTHPELPWDYIYVSKNSTINMNVVLKNPHIKWSFKSLTRNCGISIKDINNYPELLWDYKCLVFNLGYYDTFYCSSVYKQKLCKKFMEICGKELNDRLGNQYMKIYVR